MRKLTLSIISVILAFNSLVFAKGPMCATLFETSEFERLQIVQTEDVTADTKLLLSEGHFSKNLNEAALELQKMLMRNAAHVIDGKILSKDKITLSIPLGNGYHMDMLYISNGRSEGRFTIDRLEVRSPNETLLHEIRKEKFLSPIGYDFTQVEHVLSSLPVKGQQLKLELPLVLEDKLLERFDKVAQYFKFYEKDQLRHMINHWKLPWIMAHFYAKWAIDRFTEVMIKQQFKNIPQYTMAIILATGVMNTDVVKSYTEGVKTDNFVAELINKIEVPKVHSEIAEQFKEIKAQAKAIMKDKKYEYVGPEASEVVLDQTNSFSREHNTWIFEKSLNEGRQTKTYIVFSEPKAAKKGQIGIQYFIMEIDPVRYAELILFIKNQGLVVKK